MAVSDMQHFINAGQADKAREVFEQQKDSIAMAKLYTTVAKCMADISKQAAFVNANKEMSGAEKRNELERLSQLRITYAQRVEEIRIARKKEGK